MKNRAPPAAPRLPCAVSALYFMLSHFGSALLDTEPEAGAAAVVAAGEALLVALQGQVLVREALSSAAVALYAAAVLPAADPAAVARCLAQGLVLPPPAVQGEQQGEQLRREEGEEWQDQELTLLLPGQAAMARAAADAAAEVPLGWFGAALRQRGSCLAAELRRLAPLNRACAIKGERRQAGVEDGQAAHTCSRARAYDGQPIGLLLRCSSRVISS